MRESSTYQYILEEGRKEGLIEGFKEGFKQGYLQGRHLVLLGRGRTRFGEPDAATQAMLSGITDQDWIHRLADRIREAVSWQDLLQTP